MTILLKVSPIRGDNYSCQGKRETLIRERMKKILQERGHTYFRDRAIAELKAEGKLDEKNHIIR